MLLRRLLAPIAVSLLLSACPTPGTNPDGGSSAPAAIGGACASNGACSSGDCMHGVCVVACGSGCPSGSACSYTASGDYCFGTCTSGGPSSQCLSGFTCSAVQGGEACVPPGTAVCSKDTDCASGATCITGACVPGTCTISTDCPATWQCVANACVAPSGACTADNQCHSPDTCIAGVCTNPGDGCANDTDCTSPATCINGMCVTANPQCTSSSQCAQGWTCITGTCVGPAGDAGPQPGPDAGPHPGPDAGPQPGPDAGPTSCYQDSMCSAPQVCEVSGVCGPPCTSSSCTGGETCSGGHCVGTAGTGFPAADGAAPQVVKSRGPVLSTPTIIPIFFTGDTDAAAIVTFLQTLAGSTYWAATSEYGVTGMTIGTPVTLAAPAANVSDGQIQNALSQDISQGKLPQEDGSTVYVLHYPSTTTISLEQGDTSCSGFGGYHSNTGGNPDLAYAVIPRCSGGTGFSDMDVLTVAESHELIEAATDPFPNASGAYVQVDNAHIYWSAAQGGSEIADMCENDPEAYDNQIAGLTNYYVQRFWSNTSMTAGHDPCVPEFANTVFFQSVPELSSSVSINAGTGGNVTAKGVNIAVGGTGTVKIDLYTDGVTSDWQVWVQDFATWSTYPYVYCQSATECDGQTMNITLSAGSGNNGDQITATINPIKAPSSLSQNPFPGNNYDIFVITSTQMSTGNQHFWFGLVGE